MLPHSLIGNITLFFINLSVIRSKHIKVRPQTANQWQADYLFRLGIGSWVIHLSVVSLSFPVLNSSNAVWPLIWLIAMAVISLLLGSLSVLYTIKNKTGCLRPVKWLSFHAVLTTVAGLTWGTGAVLCSLETPAHLLFFTLVLGGTALGAVSSQHSYLVSCYLSLWTSIPLLSLAHFLAGNSIENRISGVLILLFGIMLSILGWRMHRFLANNVALNNRLDAKVVELEEVQQQLDQALKVTQEANEAKSRLLAQASHDLRQPVHAAGLFIAHLKEKTTDPDSLQILDRIGLSLASLSRLFRSLLDIAALDLGRVKVNITAFPIQETIDQVVRQAEALARKSNVTIRTVPTVKWVRTDPALLETILQNLVINAIKYAPGNDILLGCRRTKDTVSIEVIDQGQGIPTEKYDEIFKEFSRLPDALTKGVDGLGLGLAIVKRMADLIGVTVTVYSQPGKGSRFVISGMSQTPPIPASNPESQKHQLFQRLKIVVIDDDALCADGIASLLGSWGCEIMVFNALPAKLPATDFLIIDQNLGTATFGIDWLEEFYRSGNIIPAALLTASSEDQLAKRCQSLSIPLLRKPVQPGQLRSLLIAATKRQTSPAHSGRSDLI